MQVSVHFACQNTHDESSFKNDFLVSCGSCTYWAEWQKKYLSYERRVVAMLEVTWENLLGEKIFIDYNESDSITCPFDCISV
jgi:hypothetical protein